MSNNNVDGDLQSRYEFNSSWAERIAFLIIIGLPVEIAAVFIFQKPFWEGLSTIVANVLIVAGVWGELIFERRAKAAGDGIVAEAKARAAEANQKAQEAALELARLITPRVISPEQQRQLVEAVKPFAKTPFDVSIQPDPEPLALMEQICEALVEAGWDWRPVKKISLNRPGKPSVGMHTGQGVQVLVESTMMPEWEPAVLALANVLHRIGLETIASHADDGRAPPRDASASWGRSVR
jgi:hypothetical protein